MGIRTLWGLWLPPHAQYSYKTWRPISDQKMSRLTCHFGVLWEVVDLFSFREGWRKKPWKKGLLAFLVQHCHQAKWFSCFCQHISVLFLSRSRDEGVRNKWGLCSKGRTKGASHYPSLANEWGPHHCQTLGLLYHRAIITVTQKLQAWIFGGSHVCQGMRSSLPRSPWSRYVHNLLVILSYPPSIQEQSLSVGTWLQQGPQLLDSFWTLNCICFYFLESDSTFEVLISVHGLRGPTEMLPRGHLSVCQTFNPPFLSSSLPPTLPSFTPSFSLSSLTACLPILILSAVPLCLLSSLLLLVSIFSVFWLSFHSVCTFAVSRNSAPRVQCPLPISLEFTKKARTPAQSNCMRNNCKDRTHVEHSCPVSQPSM